MKGKFITVEGIEGVGKSTNLDCIRSVLERHDIDCVFTREPGGTTLGEKVRSLLLDRDEHSMTPTSELLLMFASRAQHVEEVILPAIESGRWVVSDRFTDSSYAYQGGGRGISRSLISQLEAIALGSFKPDLTILLDLPVEIGLERARVRGEQDRFERQGIAFFERVRSEFLWLAKSESRIKVVDATLSLEAVNQAVRAIIETLVNNATLAR